MTQIQQMVSVRSGGRREGGRRERDVRTEEEWREGRVEDWSRRGDEGELEVMGEPS